MADDLKPCKCNEDIDVNLRIEMLWQGHIDNVYVVYCCYCRRAASFTMGPQGMYLEHEVNKRAYRAWNERED